MFFFRALKIKGPGICPNEMCQRPSCFRVMNIQSWFLLMQLLVVIFKTLPLFAPNKREEYILLTFPSAVTCREFSTEKTPELTLVSDDPCYQSIYRQIQLFHRHIYIFFIK